MNTKSLSPGSLAGLVAKLIDVERHGVGSHDPAMSESPWSREASKTIKSSSWLE